MCDVVLHVLNMFHYFRTPYIICTFFVKCIYNEYIRPYFFIAHCFYDFRRENHATFIIFAQHIHIFNIPLINNGITGFFSSKNQPSEVLSLK
jgi:hypothetical protein